MTTTILDAALDTLTAACDEKSFGDATDPATARRAFELLLGAGHSFAAFEVAQGAVARGWTHGAAVKLGVIAEAVRDGRPVEAAGPPRVDERNLESWQAQARHEDP